MLFALQMQYYQAVGQNTSERMTGTSRNEDTFSSAYSGLSFPSRLLIQGSQILLKLSGLTQIKPSPQDIGAWKITFAGE